MNELILNWQRRVDLDENLYYKKAADRQTIFIRDTICRNLLKTPCFVVSCHMSKSCLLPVYLFRLTNGIEVICRDNFYGWVVSIKTPSVDCTINLSSDLAHGDSKDGDGIRNGNIYPVYCEGFKEDGKYSGDYIAWIGLLGLMKGLESDGRYECRAVYWFDN